MAPPKLSEIQCIKIHLSARKLPLLLKTYLIAPPLPESLELAEQSLKIQLTIETLPSKE